jgi:predicted amidophosphoribosyltransferase
MEITLVTSYLQETKDFFSLSKGQKREKKKKKKKKKRNSPNYILKKKDVSNYILVDDLSVGK